MAMKNSFKKIMVILTLTLQPKDRWTSTSLKNWEKTLLPPLKQELLNQTWTIPEPSQTEPELGGIVWYTTIPYRTEFIFFYFF